MCGNGGGHWGDTIITKHTGCPHSHPASWRLKSPHPPTRLQDPRASRLCPRLLRGSHADRAGMGASRASRPSLPSPICRQMPPHTFPHSECFLPDSLPSPPRPKSRPRSPPCSPLVSKLVFGSLSPIGPRNTFPTLRRIHKNQARFSLLISRLPLRGRRSICGPRAPADPPSMRRTPRTRPPSPGDGSRDQEALPSLLSITSQLPPTSEAGRETDRLPHRK